MKSRDRYIDSSGTHCNCVSHVFPSLTRHDCQRSTVEHCSSNGMKLASERRLSYCPSVIVWSWVDTDVSEGWYMWLTVPIYTVRSWHNNLNVNLSLAVSVWIKGQDLELFNKISLTNEPLEYFCLHPIVETRHNCKGSRLSHTIAPFFVISQLIQLPYNSIIITEA